MKMKGIIALDIDGTITIDHLAIPAAVVKFLNGCVLSGWRIIFITGRTFSWGYSILSTLPFPYYLAVQNGAILLEMPSKKILAKKYLDRSIIGTMDEICRDEPSDFVIYAGYEHQDVCFYRPQKFSSILLNYVSKRSAVFGENWHSLDSFEQMHLDSFASVKCFGKEESAERMAKNIESSLGLHVPVIRDPFDENYFIVQATHPAINKGQALKDYKALMKNPGFVIAAGDDNNDLTMLQEADIKIVMSTAPMEVLKIADIVAPPAEEEGIIIGLQEAIYRMSDK